MPSSSFNNFFYFDTISSQDAGFGLPDLCAFSIDSDLESIFFSIDEPYHKKIVDP